MNAALADKLGESPLRRLIVQAVLCALFVAMNAVASENNSSVRKGDAGAAADPVACEAVVQKYVPSAMHDNLGAGGFTMFDAVVFKVVSPTRKVGEVIRVYAEAGSVPADSLLRRTGSRYRFEFDFALLKQQQLGLGALRKLENIGAAGAAAPPK